MSAFCSSVRQVSESVQKCPAQFVQNGYPLLSIGSWRICTNGTIGRSLTRPIPPVGGWADNNKGRYNPPPAHPALVLIIIRPPPNGGTGRVKLLPIVPWVRILYLPIESRGSPFWTNCGGHFWTFLDTCRTLAQKADMSRHQKLLKKWQGQQNYFFRQILGFLVFSWLMPNHFWAQNRSPGPTLWCFWRKAITLWFHTICLTTFCNEMLQKSMEMKTHDSLEIVVFPRKTTIFKVCCLYEIITSVS